MQSDRAGLNERQHPSKGCRVVRERGWGVGGWERGRKGAGDTEGREGWKAIFVL